MEYIDKIYDLCKLINKRTKYNASFMMSNISISVYIYKQGQHKSIYNKNLYYEFAFEFEYEELISDLNKFLNKSIKENEVA